MGQPVESKRCYVAVSAKGCRKLWEDVELARWAIASVASARSQMKSLVLSLRPSQPCHGDVIARALAEAMAQREGALPRLVGLGLCEVGVEEPSLFVPS